MAGGAKLATGWLELTVSTAGAQQSIVSEMTGAGQKSARGFSAGFGILAGAVGGVIAGVTSKAIGALSGLVGEAVQASDATDKFKQTLSFAGLDTSAIDALSKSTRAYADATVYSLSDIQGITAQLAANGVEGYDKLAEAAGNLNAVAGGNAETYRSVGMVLTQTAGAGKLTTENWNQLANAIPGASGILQKALLDAGAYTGNFRDEMAKGEITAQEFNAAITAVGLTDVAQKAATSTSTIEGALGGLQAAFVGLFADGISKAKPAITGAINFVADAVSGIGPLLSSAAGTIGPIFAQIGPALAPLFSVVSQLAPQFLGLWATISPVGVVLKSLAPVLPQIAGLLGTLANTLGGALGSAVGQLVPVLSHLAAIFVGVLGKAFAVILPIIGQIIPIIGQIAQALGGALGAVLTAIAPVLQMFAGLLGQLVPIIMPIVTAVLGLIAPILSLISPLLQLIGPILQPLIGLFTAILQPILALIPPLVQALVPALQTVVGVLTTVISWVAAAIEWFVKWVTGNKEAGDQFQVVWGAVMGFFAGIGQFFANVWNGLIGGISNMVGSVVNFFTSLPGQIGAVFAGAGQWLWDAGVNIVNGLIDGIRSMAGAIGKWFLSIIPDWIKAPFMAALGIHSPSRVFKQYGVYTMQGFIDGVTSMEGRVQSAADAAGQLNPPSSARAGVSAGQGGSSVQVSAPVNIRMYDRDPRIVGAQIGRGIEGALHG